MLISVDLPSPDSPTTIRVNSKPFFTVFRWTMSGKLPNPMYSIRHNGKITFVYFSFPRYISVTFCVPIVRSSVFCSDYLLKIFFFWFFFFIRTEKAIKMFKIVVGNLYDNIVHENTSLT